MKPGQTVKPGGSPWISVPEMNAQWVQRAKLVDGHAVSCSCIACGRALRDAKSIERGIGPVCYAKTLKVDTRTGDLFDAHQ